MDLKAGTTLVAPAVKNSSCTHPRYTGSVLFYHIGLAETVEAIFILILTLGVIGANAIVIFVINNRHYSSYIQQQPRYLLTSLALNDLAIGFLITPFGLPPALLHCWPYGEIFCQIQALLRGALAQQTAVILVCMAIDRYMYALYPIRYHQVSSKKGCVAILSTAWIVSLVVFGILVLPKGYYFNNTGLMGCEPFYSKPSYRILATCALYFPTTMVLMYCYGSSFHMSQFADNGRISSITQNELNITKKDAAKNFLYESTSRSMAAISLGFIVMVTPWTIQEIVTACTGSKLPPFLDFMVTWTSLSNSFWNPFLYWLLNSHFRKLCKFILSKKTTSHYASPNHKPHCCNSNSDCDQLALPMPPRPPISRPPNTSTSRHDIEKLSEQYWGEILERTLSTTSLHALERKYPKNQKFLNEYNNFNNITEMDIIQCNNNDNLPNRDTNLSENNYHDVNCARNRNFYSSCMETALNL